MKYLKIQNRGELDVRLIALMGATTKFTDDTKLGKFGTGLKYAISYFLRNEIEFRLFVGTEEVFFNIEKNEIGTNTFDEIYCNGKSMNITTHYGHQWAAWEGVREIWSNAKDEGDQSYRKIDERAKIEGELGKTSFYIEMTKEIGEVFKNWGDYFLNGEVAIYEDENVAIYPNNGKYLRLYKNGILIESNKNYKSLFNYDLKHAELNELRQYRGYHNSDIGLALLSSSKEVISILLESIKGSKESKDWLGEVEIGELFEQKISWEYLSPDKAKVKKLFTGYLFLHPDSDVALSGRSVKVSAGLFSLLQKAGLPCEKVNKQRGGCYGGGGIGYSETTEVKYKEISMPELEERIKAILDKYAVKTEFIVAAPKNSKFDLLVSSTRKVIFSSDLDVLSDKDLEATVLVAMFHTQQGSIYKAFKRLIKFIMSKPYFRDILFGKNEA